MSLLYSDCAFAASAKPVILDCPSLPIRPHVVLTLLSRSSTSQNLLEFPSWNSNQRLIPAEASDSVSWVSPLGVSLFAFFFGGLLIAFAVAMS